jgi:hypothetical protein
MDLPAVGGWFPKIDLLLDPHKADQKKQRQDRPRKNRPDPVKTGGKDNDTPQDEIDCYAHPGADHQVAENPVIEWNQGL